MNTYNDGGWRVLSAFGRFNHWREGPDIALYSFHAAGKLIT